MLGAISHAVLQNIGGEMFPELQSHMLEMEPENNHVHELTKSVSKAYSKIRMHHLTKTYNTEITGKYIRKNWSKVILFKNQ